MRRFFSSEKHPPVVRIYPIVMTHSRLVLHPSIPFREKIRLPRPLWVLDPTAHRLSRSRSSPARVESRVEIETKFLTPSFIFCGFSSAIKKFFGPPREIRKKPGKKHDRIKRKSHSKLVAEHRVKKVGSGIWLDKSRVFPPSPRSPEPRIREKQCRGAANEDKRSGVVVGAASGWNTTGSPLLYKRVIEKRAWNLLLDHL